MSARKTGLPSWSVPSASLGDVHLHGAREGVRDDQRRGGQVVHLDVGVDPALEVAVAGEHRGDGEVVVVDGLGDLLRQRAGVADAGGAAVADEVEADLVEVRGEPRLVEVVGDDLGARGEGGLDPRLAGQALLDRLLGDERGGDHDVRVRGVGAGGDRGDRDRAVVDLVGRAVGGGDRDRAGRHAVGGRPGRRRPGRTPCPPRRRRRRSCGRRCANCSAAFARTMRSCGRFGPAMDGTTVERSSSSFSEKSGSAAGSSQRPCSLAYASTSATCCSERPVSLR